jgi:hypothetical protein
MLICGIYPPGVNFIEKTISVQRTTITFSIWDLGGQREFMNMLPLVSNDAVAILFMFDLPYKSTLSAGVQQGTHFFFVLHGLLNLTRNTYAGRDGISYRHQV